MHITGKFQKCLLELSEGRVVDQLEAYFHIVFTWDFYSTVSKGLLFAHQNAVQCSGIQPSPESHQLINFHSPDLNP